MMNKIIELIGEKEIEKRIEEMACTLTKEFQDKYPLVIGVLNGSFMFYSDLVKRLPIELEAAFMRASSYNDGTESNRDVKISAETFDLDTVENRDIILIEDIVDTGNTIKELDRYFKEKGANSVTTVSLLSKPSRREVDFEPDLFGFEIEDRFVVGYGLDFSRKYRNLPYVGYIDVDEIDFD